MGLLTNERDFINRNVKLYEGRIGSQMARFLDRSPTYVRYFHINNSHSTTDMGLEGIERYLGRNSPVRFDEINDLPIYGIEQIVLDLGMEDHGMDSSFDGGDGVLLPNTVRPIPGDFFTITYLEQNILFQVTEIKYDTLKSKNFYKIQFSIKSVSEDSILNLERQTVERFNCLIDRVGSDENIIIKSSVLEQVQGLQGAYHAIQQSYLDIFYDEKYNTLLYPDSTGLRIYDRFQTKFINKNKLLTNPREYRTIRLSDEDVLPTHTFNMQNRHLIYRAIEERDIKWLKNVCCVSTPVTHMESIFVMHNDKSIRSIDILQVTDVGETYLTKEMLDKLKNPPKAYPPGVVEVVKPPEGEEGVTVITPDPEGEEEGSTTPEGETVPETTIPDPESEGETTPENTNPEGEEEGSTTPEGETVPETTIPDPESEDNETVTEPTESSRTMSYKDGEDVVFDISMLDELDNPEPDVNPHEDLIPNETDSYDPIPEPPKVTIIDVPDVEIPVVIKYDSILDDYVIQYMEGRSRDLNDLKIQELMDYVRDMNSDWNSFIMTPILLFVINKTLENIAH